MLIVLMYHRILNEETSNSSFYQHLKYLAENFAIVTPGEKLSVNRTSLCLTFDDAYFDFYHFVFPLLKELNIKALLAVPTKFILDKTVMNPTLRLNVPYARTVDDSIYPAFAPFCTWEEIKEMATSNQVTIASHSYNHTDLTDPKVDLNKEIFLSKQLIEEKIGKSVSTFVYPFGKMNALLHQKVKQNYSFAMRIGSSVNLTWQNSSGIIYRIDADQFWQQHRRWGKQHSFKYFCKYLSNIIRRK